MLPLRYIEHRHHCGSFVAHRIHRNNRFNSLLIFGGKFERRIRIIIGRISMYIKLFGAT